MTEAKEENSKPFNEFFYTWRVENIHLWWLKTGEKLNSPTFEIDWLPKSSFSLCLYPKGSEGNEDYISYFLAVEDQVSISNKRFKTDLYLLAADGSKVEPESSEGFMSMRKYGMFGCPRFMSWKTLMYKKSNYFPDEILSLFCRVWSEVKPEMKGSKSTEVKVCSDQSFARTQIKKEVIAKQMVIDRIAPKGQKIGEIKSILQDYPIATFSTTFDKISGHRSLTIDIDVEKDARIKLAIFKLMLIDEKKRRIFWMNTYPWNDDTKFENIVLSSHFPPKSAQYAPHEMFVERFLFLACQFSFTTGLVVQKREKDDYGANLNYLLPVYLPHDEQTVQCPTLADALMDMCQDVTFCDVVISKDNLLIPAHKFMLYSRSIKFETILSGGVKGLTQLIKVEDSPDTMLKVKKFLYTGAIPDINWKIATTLYSAAKKYEIDLLKQKCCDFITANLDKCNVVEILLLAKEHNDVELIASTRNFIMENRTAVYSSDEWNNFRKSHSNLAVEIMLPKFQSE